MPIGNVNDRSRVLHPKISSVVKCTQNGDIIFCLGILESAWAGIGDEYAEQKLARRIG